MAVSKTSRDDAGGQSDGATERRVSCSEQEWGMRVEGERREADSRVRRRQCEFTASTGEYSFIKLSAESG